MNPLTIFASRFVAGERPQDAVRAGERLHAKGIRATFDELGEDVHDRAAAARASESSCHLLRLIPAGVERNISIKMSSMGQEISREFCIENVSKVLDVARETGGFVRFDMEGSKLTESTIGIFHELRKRYDNVGIVLQAYLHRTPDDVKEAIRRKDRVRLCKGAYSEPPGVAIQDMASIRRAFTACAQELVSGMIDYSRAQGIPASRFEFQMLYGLRPRRWEELVAGGFNMRVYVPFGTHWMPYFYRRLRERRENVLFVLRGLFR